MNTTQIATAYDRIAEEYGRVRSPSVGLKYIDMIIGMLPNQGKVLDIGCGTGIPIARRLVENGLAVHGIDVSARMISLARQNVPKATFEIADIISWSADESFDGFVAWDSLFHLVPQQHGLVIGRLLGMLKTNGVALMSFGGTKGEICSSMLGEKFYYASLAADEYMKVLSGTGCEIVLLEEDQPNEAHIVIVARKKANKASEAIGALCALQPQR